MICPNLNSPEAKAIIDKVGIVQLYKLFRENGYSMPNPESVKPTLGNLSNSIPLMEVLTFSEMPNADNLTPEQLSTIESTVNNSLIEDQERESLGWKAQKPYIVLDEKTSSNLDAYIKKSRGVLPTEFYDIKKDVKYIKSNRHKKSMLYDVLDYKTGEVLREKVKIFHRDTFSAGKTTKKQELLDSFGETNTITKAFSAKRSISFSLYRQLPSKAKFVAQAKKYLYQSLKMQDADVTGEKAQINLQAIDKLLDMFPEQMFDYINTTILPENSNAVTASISLANSIQMNLPKLGIIKKLESDLGIPLLGVTFKNFDRTGGLKWLANWGEEITIGNNLSKKDLKKAIFYYLSNVAKVITPSTEQENIAKYAEDTGTNIDELYKMLNSDAAYDNIIGNSTGNSDTIELSKWRESVRNYNWKSRELFGKLDREFKEEASRYVQEKYSNKELSNGLAYLDFFFSGEFNWLNINFNSTSGNYLLGEDGENQQTGVEYDPKGRATINKPDSNSYLKAEESYNRLASVLHEPFHALHALSYGTQEEKNMREAFDKLYQTQFGKEMIEQALREYRGGVPSMDLMYKEFTAFAFQLMNYPKDWIKKTNLRSNDIYEFVEKIQNLQDKTYQEIVTTRRAMGTVDRTTISQEVIKLNFLEKLYNLFISAIHKLIPIAKQWVKLLETSKTVSKTTVDTVFGEEQQTITRTAKLPARVVKERQNFLDALDELKANMTSLLDIDTSKFSSDNVNEFFQTSNSYDQETGRVNYSLKVVDALVNPKRNVIRPENLYNKFYKSNPGRFYSDLNTQLGVPKEQVQMLKEFNQMNQPQSLDEMIAGIAAQFLFPVEIEPSVETGRAISVKEYNEYAGEVVDVDLGYDELDEPQFTDHYSYLTVPGGTNYRENEIRTPDIIPVRKGHGAFSTENGIGWARTDDRLDQIDDYFIIQELENSGLLKIEC